MQPMQIKFPPSIVALLLQFAAIVLLLLTVKVTGWHGSPLLIAALCGLFALIFSFIAGLAKWWLAIQLLFAPALVLMLAAEFPPSLFLGAFLILLLVYWSTFRTQVPLYLSSNKVWQAIEHMLPGEKAGTGFTFIDLGSGLGGVLTHLASVRPDGQYIGVESAPLPFFCSWLRIRLLGYRNCRVQWGSLWDCDLSECDIVFAYLSPVPMEKLWNKAHTEMRPGTKFISNTFDVLEHPPQETLQVDDMHRSTLYVWLM
ncbi:MAG: Trans-aconitate 2-methyltransferase [Candidatus Gallionella acididurans]|uniref:Trans-aconitate 2-methyltransferase n=1 Tax=Candidatus Gallionella acididurans TaxID=1796491 RepID=A0A139BXQ1_9PROT|nr:MAG: Trans-aconitate 2-methyltransferase [Candidatus Gallionella acididurans]